MEKLWVTSYELLEECCLSLTRNPKLVTRNLLYIVFESSVLSVSLWLIYFSL
jgi:hypothetical protein